MGKVHVLRMGEFSGYFYEDTTDLEELTDIHLELNSLYPYRGSSSRIESRNLKIRIALVTLNIMKKTIPSKSEILNAAYDLSVFSGFDFDDELNEIFYEISSLVNDRSLSKRDIFIRWKDIKDSLEEYLVD